MTDPTPGPWTQKLSLIEPASKRCRVISGPHGQAIAFVNIWHDAEEEGERNADLIEAAPALLKVLEEQTEWLELITGLAGHKVDVRLRDDSTLAKQLQAYAREGRRTIAAARPPAKEQILTHHECGCPIKKCTCEVPS